jgi:anti-sigma regulatory factor (Ser/Thr protein kinase)
VNKIDIKLAASLDNLDELRKRLTSYICSVQPEISSDWQQEIKLIATELFTNICKHSQAAGKPILTRIKFYKSMVTLFFCDKGKPWNPDKIPPPNLSNPQESGYGLYLVRSMSKKFYYKYIKIGEYNNITIIEKKLPEDNPDHL